MRGRKPKQDAARRGGIIPTGHVEAAIVEADPPVMPARVASNADMAAMWDTHLSWQGHLRAEDAPLMEAWCFWAVVSDQCARDLDEDPSPELIRKAEKASTMLMRLGDQLHLTPTARQRAGLISAMTRSTQADVVTKTREEFRRMREAE